MIKLNYKSTYTFSSLDVFDYADTEPIIYEACARLGSDWAAMARNWMLDDPDNVDKALEIIGLAIVSVSQGGERFVLNGRAGAEALREAIEVDNPGHGDTFIKHLALGHYALHFRRAEERLGNLEKPSVQSAGGTSPAK